jgi:hypothetical protein
MHTIRYKSYIQGWTFVHVSASSCHPQGVTNTKWYLSNIIDYKNNARNKGKVKCTLVQALRLCTGRTAHSGSKGIALPFHDHGTRRGEWSASRPGRNLPPGKTRYPLYIKLGGPQVRSGRPENLAPPGFDPRTVQPVLSRYTDWATRPTTHECITSIITARDNTNYVEPYRSFATTV